MTVRLPTPTIDKLAKVCGLLGSDQDGERAAAAYHATVILRAAGFTWRDVIERAFDPSPPRYGPPVSWQAEVAAFLQQADFLTDWEVDFLRSIRWRSRISDKQRRVLENIKNKLEGEP